MGNRQAIFLPKLSGALHVVKPDGKVLEFTSSMLVSDLLIDFPNCGVWVSRDSAKDLPENFRMHIGNVYYLIPLLGTEESVETEPSSVSETEEDSCGTGKRIKVMITRHQLKELLLCKGSVEDVLAMIGGRESEGDSESQSWDESSLGWSWKPELETIPEDEVLLFLDSA